MSKHTEITSQPATIAFTSRMDAKSLATLALFWQKQGEQFPSTSAMVRTSLEVLAELLIENGQAEMVQTQSSALEILDDLGLQVKVNKRALAQAMVKEGVGPINPSARPVGKQHQHNVATNPVSQQSPQFKNAQERLEEKMAEELEDRTSAAEARTAQTLKALGIPVGGTD